MSLGPEQSQSLSPIKRALLALEDMQAKLDAVESAKREPIAIIGMGCRFPGGVESPEDFWQLLSQGVDAITDVPADRWDADAYYDPDPDAPGKIYTRKGGFLRQVDQFNPQFFGISAREATSLDPQQRLLLEVSWEALERANHSPERLFNTTTGVFIGICANDYNKRIWQSEDLGQVDAFSATGNALSVAAGRLSYTLGLKGPSLAVDTACSSALVAVHLACQQLRQQDCDLALAGGINLLLAPDSTIAFAKTRMLNPDGQCKTFDADANGYVRGEGCGVIVLKRLTDAIAAGDHILAVIRGSAVNHNGRSSSLIAPNGPAQQAVIRKALEVGGVDPATVGYVEVQGTGTAFGEPIEVGALESVFCKHRPATQPLVIGSVKTNIGHLEAASGIASLMKVVLAMQHGEIPAHLHLKQPNPHIEWDKLPLQIPTQRQAWTPIAQRRLAGVSAFGFSGTNAHLIVEEAPVTGSMPSDVERPLHVLTLSAKTEVALTRLVEQYEKFLALHPDTSLADLCFSANGGRSHFPYRLSVVAKSPIDLGETLMAFTDGQSPTGLRSGKAATAPKVAFLFPCDSVGFVELGRQLYDTQPTFRSTLDHCNKLLEAPLGRSLSDSLNDSSSIPAPLLFAVEYALANLWQSWGIEPTVVLGEGVGEVAAACVAGVFSLEDAVKLVTRGEAVADELGYTPPQISFISSHTGLLAAAGVTKPEYWRDRPQSGKLAESVATLREQGCDVVLELSSHPGCLKSLPEGLSQGLVWLPELTSTPAVWQQLLESLGVLYVQGAQINWAEFDRGYARRSVQLPTYPWERQRYWIETVDSESTSAGQAEPQQLPVAIAQLLQGNSADLTQHLKATGKLTEAELTLLPKVLNLLIESPQPSPSSSNASVQPVNSTPLTTADIQTWLVDRVAKELGVKPGDLDVQAPFDSYGLDSMLAISIASAGQKFLGVEVSPLLLVHYPTIASLSQYLAAEFEASDSEVFEI